MADTLVDSEILGIWQRIKRYLNLDAISATDKMNQKEQLRSAMESPAQTSAAFPVNLDTLVDNGFPNEFVENPEIRKQLLQSQIQSFQVRSVTRFQIAKGTASIQLPTGKFLRAGQFLGGKSEQEALESLRLKTEKI